MRRMIFVLALAVLAGSIAPAYAQQTPNARVFNGGAGLILYTIKADKTADFEIPDLVELAPKLSAEFSLNRLQLEAT